MAEEQLGVPAALDDEAATIADVQTALAGYGSGLLTIGRRRSDLVSPAQLTPPIMASPPTVTITYGIAGFPLPAGMNASSTVTTWAASGGNLAGKITHIGGEPNPTQSSAINVSQRYANGGALTGTPEFSAWANEFWFSGQRFSLYGSDGALTANFRLMVDDQWITATATAPAFTPADGLLHRVDVVFGGTELHKIRIENDNWQVQALAVEPTNSFWPSTILDEPFAVLGHSYVGGTTGMARIDGFQFVMARLLRLGNMFSLGQGGTGYLNPGTGIKKTFINRLPDVAACGATKLLVSGPYNDRTDSPSGNAGYTAAALQTAVSALLAALPAACPLVNEVWLMGCEQPTGSPTASMTSATNAVSAAVAAANISGITVHFIDKTGWYTGTGKAGSTTGSGNCDLFVMSDGVHLTTAGHAYEGTRVAMALEATYTPGYGAS